MSISNAITNDADQQANKIEKTQTQIETIQNKNTEKREDNQQIEKIHTEEREEGEYTPENSPQFLSTKSLDNLILEETNEEPITPYPCVITPTNDYVKSSITRRKKKTQTVKPKNDATKTFW